MKHLVIDDNLGGSEGPGYRFHGVRAVGPCRSSLFAPPDFALQMMRATLARGTELHWSPHAGDEVVYVQAGSVSTADDLCPSGGTVPDRRGHGARRRGRERDGAPAFRPPKPRGACRRRHQPRRGCAWSGRRHPTPPPISHGTPASTPSPTKTSPPPSSTRGEPDRIARSPTVTPRTRSSTWPRVLSRWARDRYRSAPPLPFPLTAATGSGGRRRIRPVLNYRRGTVVLLGL